MIRATALAATLTAALAPCSASAQSIVSCLLKPSMTVPLASSVEGVLAEVGVDRGDRVAQGQVLARLESDVEKRVLQAARFRAENDAVIRSREAQLREALQRLEQVETLRARGVATAQAFNEITAEVEVARNLVREAEMEREMARLDVLRVEAELERRVLRAPAAGVVLERHLDPGAYASEQAPVLTLVATDPVYAEVLLPAAARPLVRVGQRLTLEVEGAVQAPAAGEITVVDPVVDAASGTFGLRVTVPNPDGRLVAGLRCRPSIPALRDPM